MTVTNSKHNVFELDVTVYVSNFFFFLEREGITNKPRRTRHWFSRRCGRCLTNTGSIRSSVSSVGQYTPEIPSQTYSSNQFVSSESENNDNNTRSSVVDLSSQSMQRCQVDDSKSLQEQRTNCENDYVSLSSLRSTNFEGTTSSYEDRKCYTHQLVVVAPITSKYTDSKRYLSFANTFRQWCARWSCMRVQLRRVLDSHGFSVGTGQ